MCFIQGKNFIQGEEYGRVLSFSKKSVFEGVNSIRPLLAPNLKFVQKRSRDALGLFYGASGNLLLEIFLWKPSSGNFLLEIFFRKLPLEIFFWKHSSGNLLRELFSGALSWAGSGENKKIRAK
jgi:hypothetical protein